MRDPAEKGSNVRKEYRRVVDGPPVGETAFHDDHRAEIEAARYPCGFSVVSEAAIASSRLAVSSI